MVDDAAAPYLPDRPPSPAPANTPTVFEPQPVTMAELLAETAPETKPAPRKSGLGRLAGLVRRKPLSPAEN